MEIKTMNMEQLNERLAAIKTELETAENIAELSAEVDAINERKAELEASAEQRKATIEKIVAGEPEATPIITPNKETPKMERTFAVDSAEYREAWLKNLMGRELDAEERGAMTASSAIPTQTLNEVVAAFDRNPLLSRVDMTHFPSYVKIPVESTANAASWTGTAQDSEDALGYIELNAYQLIKTIEIQADVNAMSIPAFEQYLVSRLINKIENALEIAIISGDGSSKATGIAQTISTATGTFTSTAVTKKDLLTIMGKLPGQFQRNACWIMPAKVFYDEVMNISTHDSFVNVNDGFNMKLFGKDVIIENNATISSVDNIFYGDLKHYRLNLAEGIKVDKDSSVGFRSNSQVYRAVCLADGKLDLAKAFVRYTRSTN